MFVLREEGEEKKMKVSKCRLESTTVLGLATNGAVIKQLRRHVHDIFLSFAIVVTIATESQRTERERPKTVRPHA